MKELLLFVKQFSKPVRDTQKNSDAWISPRAENCERSIDFTLIDVCYLALERKILKNCPNTKEPVESLLSFTSKDRQEPNQNASIGTFEKSKEVGI
eukprot:scaffold4223_cov189-Amphora_coffeaeformis.AAC.66